MLKRVYQVYKVHSWDYCLSKQKEDTTLLKTVSIRQHALIHGYMKGLANFSFSLQMTINLDDDVLFSIHPRAQF